MRLSSLALIAALGLALAACGSDGPSVDDDKLEAATTAAEAMEERFDAADPAGEPPRASDAAVAADLAAIYDNEYLASLPTLPFSESDGLGDWSLAGNEIGLRYLLWGTGKSEAEEIGTDEATLNRINENTVTYREELGPYFDFALRVTEALARSAAAHVATLDGDALESSRGGIERMQGGFAQTIAGSLSVLETPGLPDDWIVARLPAIKASRETASTFLTPEAWQEVKDYANAVADAASNAEVATALREFAQ